MKHVIFIPLFLAAALLKAPHAQTIWAVDVAIQQDSLFSYKSNIGVYTKGAPLQDIVFHWGDGSVDTLVNSQGHSLGYQFYTNKFRATHAYSSVPPSGYYVSSIEMGQFPGEIQNIMGTGTYSHLDTIRLHNPSSVRVNNPVEFMDSPIDVADSSGKITHHFNAYDPDGDSIHFALLPIPSLQYHFPVATDSLYITQDGKLVWDQPADTGKYVFLIKAEEYRDGAWAGRVQRVMTIHVKNEPTNTPYIHQPHAGVNLTPNPAHQQLTLSIPSAFIQSRSDITFNLFNLRGQKVFQHANIASSKTTLNLPELSQGVYLYQLRTDSRQIKTGKLVVE